MSLKKEINKTRSQKKNLAELDISKKYNYVNPPEQLINKLIKLYNQGKFSFVVDRAHVVIRKYPNAIIVWNILGASAAQIGMLEEAAIAFNKSLMIKPDAETFNNLGNVLSDQNNTDKAIEVYKKALMLKPNFANAYYNLGSLLAKQDKFDQAIKPIKIYIN